MKGHASFMPNIRGILLSLLLGAYSWDGSRAQQRDSNVQTSEEIRVGQGVVFGDLVPSARALSQALLNNFDLVALGMFDSAPDRDDQAVELFKPHNLTIEFDVLMLYKGLPLKDGPIDVVLSSDMLVMPGEDVSRYEARLRERQRLTIEIDSITERLSDLDLRREAEEVTLTEFENERERLLGSRERLLAQAVSMPTRMAFRSHGDTFYTMGGAIRPNVPYLIGVDRSSEIPEVYVLNEFPTSTRSIYWGEMAEDIAASLDDSVP